MPVRPRLRARSVQLVAPRGCNNKQIAVSFPVNLSVSFSCSISEFEHLFFCFVFLFRFPDCVFGAAQAARVVAEGPQLKFTLILTHVQSPDRPAG